MVDEDFFLFLCHGVGGVCSIFQKKTSLALKKSVFVNGTGQGALDSLIAYQTVCELTICTMALKFSPSRLIKPPELDWNVML